MTWDLPWVASGSAEIPLDVARAFTYAATGGVSGIIGQPFSDVLKITQTGSPSGSVLTLAGAFVAVSTFPGSITESYVGRNDATVTTTVPPTTASSRSDLVYAHITDPSQAGQPAVAAPVETRVITNVPANTTSLNSVSGYENQAGLALARIDRPAGTSTVTAAQIVDLRRSALPNIIGEMKQFAGPATAVPAGWELCVGGELSRTAYSELYAMIGTTFGVGNNSTTFNLPDMRGRTAIGAGQGSGLTNRVLGVRSGAETHVLTIPEMPSHTHNPATGVTFLTDPGTTSGTGFKLNTTGSFDIVTSGSTTATGGGTAHNIMQPYTVLNYIIRVK